MQKPIFQLCVEHVKVIMMRKVVVGGGDDADNDDDDNYFCPQRHLWKNSGDCCCSYLDVQCR